MSQQTWDPTRTRTPDGESHRHTAALAQSHRLPVMGRYAEVVDDLLHRLTAVLQGWANAITGAECNPRDRGPCTKAFPESQGSRATGKRYRTGQGGDPLGGKERHNDQFPAQEGPGSQLPDASGLHTARTTTTRRQLVLADTPWPPLMCHALRSTSSKYGS